MTKPILCVDFDGVVHSYTSGWKSPTWIPDPPVPGALEWLLKATKVFNVYIYSSRTKEPEGREAMFNWFAAEARKTFDEGTTEYLLQTLVFAHEKPPAFLTIDDRAVCFHGNFDVLDPNELRLFKPWNKK